MLSKIFVFFETTKIVYELIIINKINQVVWGQDTKLTFVMNSNVKYSASSPFDRLFCPEIPSTSMKKTEERRGTRVTFPATEKKPTFQEKSWVIWIEEDRAKSSIRSRTVLSTSNSDLRMEEVIDCHFVFKKLMTKMSTPVIDLGAQDGCPFLRENSIQMNSGFCFYHEVRDFCVKT
jgi:hypothetical protein